MYKPFSEALNYALEKLSEINVDGLPEFEKHIVFVPLDEGVESDRDLEGSLFKPDIIIMSFDAACRFRNVRDTRTLTVSQFISKIPPKASTKKGSKANSSSRVGWKDVLSAVEMKRGPKEEWPLLGHFSENVPQIVSEGMDEQLLQPRNADPATPSDVSQSQTRKIHTLAYECTAEGDCTVVTSKSAGSKKRTASEAGISSGIPSTDSKQQWGHPKQSLLDQSGTYAGEKLSDSHTTSHVINLLVQGENLDIRVQSTQLTQPGR
jgi:hypothetical protein